jgi:ABC-type multidrug transport system fused ATPase/permease subunit
LGTHDELMRKKGYYFELYHKQELRQKAELEVI